MAEGRGFFLDPSPGTYALNQSTQLPPYSLFHPILGRSGKESESLLMENYKLVLDNFLTF